MLSRPLDAWDGANGGWVSFLRPSEQLLALEHFRRRAAAAPSAFSVDALADLALVDEPTRKEHDAVTLYGHRQGARPLARTGQGRQQPERGRGRRRQGAGRGVWSPWQTQTPRHRRQGAERDR